MLDLLFSNPLAFVVILGGIILAIGIHEAAHCYMADYLGDPTPRSLGRVTLNPLAHLDPLGTLVIVVTGFFGWGKPSPVDPYNLANPKRDMSLIALAGPASNIFLAIVLALILRFLPANPVAAILILLIKLNINLALFNLIPVPPLDGSKVLAGVLNRQSARDFENFAAGNSMLLIMFLILPIFGGQSIAGLVVSPIANLLLGLLI